MCQQQPKNMKGFNLKRLIRDRNLNVDELAKLLYPTVGHPAMSLDRVISGTSELKTSQMQALSKYTGMGLDELFGYDKWNALVNGPNIHKFHNGQYRAELNTETWTAKFWHLETLVHEEVLTSGAVTLSEFFEYLNHLKDIHDLSK